MHLKQKICKHNTLFQADELGHNDRDIDYEIQRQRKLERELDCVLIRIIPDELDFNIFKEIKNINRHIKKSSKKYLIKKIKKVVRNRIFV